jgi:hypothetical protein
MLTIETDRPDLDAIDVSLFNLNGSLLLEYPYNQSNKIDVSTLPSGTYILKLETEYGSHFQKVVIWR